MRRNIRADVLSHHLWHVRARREDLRRILGGGRALVTPTPEEKERFQAEYVRLAPVEAGLATLLPSDWGVTADGSGRRFSARVEARVLEEAKELVAASAVALLQTAAEATGEGETVLENAFAVFAYLTDELQRIADDARAMHDSRNAAAMWPARRPDDAVRRLVGVGGWSMMIGGWW